MGTSKWIRMKHALGFRTRQLQDLPSSSAVNDAVTLPDSRGFSPAAGSSGNLSKTSISSASGLLSSKSSKGTCAICLLSMRSGQGDAIFMAECSHSFHFKCITSNVKHGHKICPVCRAKWKEVPFQDLASEVSHGPSPRPPPHQFDVSHHAQLYRATEPAVFNDDEALDQEPSYTNNANVSNETLGPVIIKTYPEVSAVPKSDSHENFNVLIHLQAPQLSGRPSGGLFGMGAQNTRAPIDLVTVLDVSGSMGGTKLALLKEAMSFVIQNLGPSDRLSVISFSSRAHRIFPLRRMTDAGQQEALQAINSLVSDGGTNIADGLKKGVKVFVDRHCNNPVSGIILLSDGQDNYSANGGLAGMDYQALVPNLINRRDGGGLQAPVHAFGFGADHDATLMHSISHMTGGTFSFIEAEGMIQDAFAQCIGGLLSVVVQELLVTVECIHPSLQLGSIKAGHYQTTTMADSRMASINVGDLYAEEERDFLVAVNIPVDKSCSEMSLLNAGCVYRNAITKEFFTVGGGDVKISRRDVTGGVVVSLEVDRQRNRLLATEAMSEARIAAEQGDLSVAVSILEKCHKALQETATAQAGDGLCIALSAELEEMGDRMSSHQRYEESGRAYMLSGITSHSLQRATARGDTTGSTTLVQAYQTRSMTAMVNHSQKLSSPAPRQPPRLAKSSLLPPEAP